MSLRARLVLSFTILLLIAIAAVGGIAAATTRGVLIGQIDTVLIEVDQGLVQFQGRGFVNDLIRNFARNSGLDPRGQDIARLVWLPDDNQILVFDPSRYAGDAQPPDVAYYELTEPPRPQTIPALNGPIEYRTIGRHLDGDNRIEYFAVPLTEVDDATKGLVNRLLIFGSAVLILGGAATWWTVRHDMKPVEAMIDTAAAIGSGDLSQRVPGAPETTELGRLGRAINHMLGRIETSFESEQQAQQRLKRFIADASHELRTPITSVQGYAELYRAGGLTDEEALTNAMGRIEKEAGRMGSLVEDLLLLARLDQAGELVRTPIDLRALVDEAVADLEALAPDRPIAVRGPSEAIVEGDEARLTQVITNLLSNARIHTPSNSPIDVVIERTEGRVVVDVIDDGPGLPADDLERVFDRFHRIDTSRTRKSGGSGLGLSIVSAIVRSHGGTVTAANEPDRGARFTVSLPATRP